MTQTPSATADQLTTRRRYRRLMLGSVLGGTVAWMAAAQLGYILLGIGLYWLGYLGFLVIWQGTSIQLLDERDRALERRAANYSMTAFAFVLILGWPTVIGLQELGYLTLPPEFWGAIYAFTALYTVFGAIYVALRLRS